MKEPSRRQFTIRQVMIGAGIFGSILGLGARAISGDWTVISFLGMTLFTFPMWGAFVLSLFQPTVTRRLFQACLIVAPLLSGCLLLLGAIAEEGGVFLGLIVSLWVLSTIVAFGFGHGLSREMRRRAESPVRGSQR